MPFDSWDNSIDTSRRLMPGVSLLLNYDLGMRMKALLLAILFSCVAISVVAQGARAVAGKPDAEEVRGYYDEYEKSMMESVFIPLPITIFGEDSRLEVNAHFSYPGRQLSAPPENVQVVFSVPCKFDVQLDSDPIICIDGVCTSYHPRGEGFGAGGLLRERTARMIDVPYEALRTLKA